MLGAAESVTSPVSQPMTVDFLHRMQQPRSVLFLRLLNFLKVVQLGMTVVFINPGADDAVYLSQNLDYITVTFLPFVQKIFANITGCYRNIQSW
jgi:hypothetical protein